MSDAKITTLDKATLAEAEAERKAAEEQRALDLEAIQQHNRMTISANQKSAVDWINDNKGQGVLLAMNPDGTFHTLVVGNADQLTAYEPRMDSNVFNMIMLLVGTHLPGSSMASQAFHADLVQRTDLLDQKLGALMNNLGALVSFMQMKFPELQVQRVGLDGKPVHAGLITPG